MGFKYCSIEPDNKIFYSYNLIIYYYFIYYPCYLFLNLQYSCPYLYPPIIIYQHSLYLRSSTSNLISFIYFYADACSITNSDVVCSNRILFSCYYFVMVPVQDFYIYFPLIIDRLLRCLWVGVRNLWNLYLFCLIL